MARILMFTLSLLLILGVSACSPVPEPTSTEAQSAPTIEAALPVPSAEETSNPEPDPSPTQAANTESIPVTGHLMKPADMIPEAGSLVHDVESSGSAAPYGDSYRINRFERPFQQDMTYVPDLDIVRFGLSQDDDWYYVSMSLTGEDPNNPLEINYGVEIDLNADGFGDYIVWAHPPYTTEWETETIQVFEDGDRDTAGLSSRQSDAVFDGNGYETLFFEGSSNRNLDPDLAWVRMLEGEAATIQFALKKSWLGDSFLLGVVSDAGEKDPSKFDYSDRFPEAEAGSPVGNNPHYPLGSLYAVDNTCWQAYGIENLVYQPKFCPSEVLPTATRRPSSNLQPIVTTPALSSTMPLATDTGRPPATNTNPPPATNTNPPPATNTNPPPPTNTNPPPPTNTNPPPATNTNPPPPTNTDPPPPPACTPEFDPGICDRYNPEICECE